MTERSEEGTRRSWQGRKLSRRERRRKFRYRPVLEQLEDRVTPATFQVTSLLDDGSEGTLRWAVQQANINPNGFNQDFSEAPDIIDIQVTGTIQLDSDLDLITDSVIITGQGSDQTLISGRDLYGVVYTQVGANVSVSDLKIVDGKTSFGGGVYNYGNLTLDDVVIESCEAIWFGGGIYNASTGTVTATNVSLINNFADAGGGGAIYNRGFVSLDLSYLEGNFTDGQVGGVWNDFEAGWSHSTLEVNRTTFTTNAGAIFNAGEDNNWCQLTINNSLFVDNSGYAVYNMGGSQTMNETGGLITNTTFSANSGYAIHQDADNTYLTLVNCTVTGNGVGVYNENDSGNPVVLMATIVAGNGTDLSQPAPNGEPFGFYSLGYNIIGSVNTSSFVAIGGSTVLDLIGDENNFIDPGLAALADNGGPVQTHALQAGSVAINRGSFSSPDRDARGLVREGVRDVGAYEYHQFVVTNTNSSGAGSLTQAIIDSNAHANVEGTPDLIVFQLTSGSIINLTSALPIITDAVQIIGSGSDGTPQIIIDGGGTISDGIVIGDGTVSTATSGSVIRGLVIRNFFGASLYLNDVSNATVAGNYFGTDFTGNSKVGISPVYHIHISGGFGHHIGSMDDADTNVIGGAIQGIYINNSQDNQILGNLIGTGRDGVSNIGNNIGIVVTNTQSTLIGNQFGGAAFAAFNFGPGSYSLDGRNIISNNQCGIQIRAGSSENFVYGNYIGLDAFGQASLVQGLIGVAIDDSDSNGIGSGLDTLLGNRFYGNQQHVVIGGSGSFNNEIVNNQFGESFGRGFGFSTATSIGVRIDGGAQENTVRSNNFYNTVTAAISVVGTGTANLLVNNQFNWTGQAVTGLAIDLNGDGILNANDTNDVDGGPNSMLNYPVVVDARNLGNVDTLIRVDLTSFAPGSWDSVSLNFYAVFNNSQEGDFHYNQPIPGSFKFTQADYERGYVEINIGHREVVFPGEGTVDYSWVNVGDRIAAVAVDAAGNTSEMSPSVEVNSVIVVTSTNNDGEGSLRDAIIAANADPDHSYIVFYLQSEGNTVFINTPLPEITSKVTILGNVGTGATLRFTGAASNGLVLGVGSDGSTISDLDIYGASANADFIGSGILVKSSNNLIFNNEIHDNSKGIVVVGPVRGNTFSQNRLYNNLVVSTSESIGIDINNDGVTPVDTRGVENAPAMVLFGDNNLGGSVGGAANTTYRIEFFYSNSGHEARNYLGSIEVTTDAKGVARFREFDLEGKVAIGQVITSTATNLSTGTTSELSRPLVNTNIKMSGVENPPGVVQKDGVHEPNAYLVQVGSTFQLQVQLSDPGQVYSWTIRWGDGTTTTSAQYPGYVRGETESLLVSHDYRASDAPNGFSIIFEAQTESGEIAYGTMAGLEYVQVNWIQSTIDDASSKPVNPPKNPGDPAVVEVVRIPDTTGVDKVNATVYREDGATGTMEVFVALYNDTLDVEAESEDRQVIVSYDLRVTYLYARPTDGTDTIFVGFKIPDGAIDPHIYIRLDDGTLVEPVGDPEYDTAKFVDARIGFFKNGRQGNVFYVAFSSDSNPTLTQLNGTVFTITDLNTAPPIGVVNNIIGVSQISAPNLTPPQTTANYDAADDLLATPSSNQRSNLQAGSAAPSSGIVADSGGAGNPPPDGPEMPQKVLEQVMQVTSQVRGAFMNLFNNLAGWMATNLIGPRTAQAPNDAATDKNDYQIEIPKGALEKEVDPVQSIARQNLGQVQVRDANAVTEAFSQYADETPLPDDAPPILDDQAITTEKVSLAPFFVGMPLMVAALHGPRQASRRKPSKVK